MFIKLTDASGNAFYIKPGEIRSFGESSDGSNERFICCYDNTKLLMVKETIEQIINRINEVSNTINS